MCLQINHKMSLSVSALLVLYYRLKNLAKYSFIDFPNYCPITSVATVPTPNITLTSLTSCPEPVVLFSELSTLTCSKKEKIR